MEQLIQLDHQLFFAINNGLSNPFFDWLMPFLRNRFFWAPLYLFWIIFFTRNYGRKGFVLVVFLLVTFAITDMLSSGMIKPAIHRLRPCNDVTLKHDVNSIVACGSGFSFPSSHAANHFAIALFLITVFRRKWKWIMALGLGWAFSISLAQVYVGVHFPLDVIAGAVLGCMIGYVTGTIFLTLQTGKQWHPGS
ncbi:phosphatase PAP2 family protein [Hufsiella ginkgonis]|nr:phosphatase PAP2 family protein [Hufsiella ginkgonis]